MLAIDWREVKLGSDADAGSWCSSHAAPGVFCADFDDVQDVYSNEDISDEELARLSQ